MFPGRWNMKAWQRQEAIEAGPKPCCNTRQGEDRSLPPAKFLGSLVSGAPEEAEGGGEGVLRRVAADEELLDHQRDARRPERRQLLVVAIEVHQAACAAAKRLTLAVRCSRVRYLCL